MITERDIESTISDFDVFCGYLDENLPKLTKARQELGKKDCFATSPEMKDVSN